MYYISEFVSYMLNMKLELMIYTNTLYGLL